MMIHTLRLHIHCLVILLAILPLCSCHVLDTGDELWKCNGRAAPVKFIPSSDHSSIIAVGRNVYFSIMNKESGIELWKSDGTSRGTAPVKTLGPYPGEGEVQFVAADPSLFLIKINHGAKPTEELWKSDGTAAGTILLKTVIPDPSNYPAFRNLTAVHGMLFFTIAPGGDHPRRVELWRSDGTPEGTVPLKDLFAAGGEPHLGQFLGAFGYALFFWNGGELWKSDGTPTGTQMVKKFDYGGSSNRGLPIFAEAHGRLFMPTATGLFTTDGTAQGTTLVKEFPGACYYPVTAGGLVFFLTYSDNKPQLWRSDGTAAGTVLLKQIPANLNSPGRHDDLVTVGPTLFFITHDPAQGSEIWKSNGTAAGTTLVKRISRDQPSLFSMNLVNAGGTLFFTSYLEKESLESVVPGSGLWKSDGTEAGTTLVREVVSYREQIDDIASVDSQVFWLQCYGCW